MMKETWHPHEMVAQLKARAGEPEKPPAWLLSSWEAPEAFARSVKRSMDALYTIHGASALFSKYDFFHDIVGRNRNASQPAMVWFNSQGDSMELSWSELGRLASIKAAKWARAGLEAGDGLCLIRETGPELATDLLAGFRLGAVISLLPPRGRQWMANRLEALSPKWIATDKEGAKGLGSWESALLPLVATQCDVPSDHRSFHGYASGDVVFRLFPAASGAQVQPVDVTCDTAYLGAISDGMLGMGLYPGMRLCTPGFDALQTQPTLLLSALMCGATTIYLTVDGIKRLGGFPRDAAPDLLGVTPELRDLILEEGLSLPEGIGAWFKDPVSSFEYDRWQMLASKESIQGAQNFNLRLDAASGGAVLFSLRKEGIAHPGGLPMPGRSWQVGEEESEAAALYQVGELHTTPAGEPQGTPQNTGLTLSALGSVWICSRGPEESREGLAYPKAEVEALLAARSMGSDLSFCVVTYPRADLKGSSMVVLVGFSGARGDSAFPKRLEAEVTTLIASEMGQEALPDRMGIYPIYPKCEAPGAVDVQWCRHAWISGALSRRSKNRAFQCTTRLRARLMASPS